MQPEEHFMLFMVFYKRLNHEVSTIRINFGRNNSEGNVCHLESGSFYEMTPENFFGCCLLFPQPRRAVGKGGDILVKQDLYGLPTAEKQANHS